MKIKFKTFVIYILGAILLIGILSYGLYIIDKNTIKDNSDVNYTEWKLNQDMHRNPVRVPERNPAHGLMPQI